MLNNPFVIAGKIPEPYFCDRIEESEKLIRYITNHHNVVIISQRRMGKSGLIRHCFDKEVIKENYKTIYIDILQTSSLKEFVFLFGKAVFDNLVNKKSKWLTRFFQTLKSLNGKFSIDPVSGYPSFNITLGEIESPKTTLEEIFNYIENYEQRCIIAFDEFQQITRYPEKNIEAILRTHISQSSNSNYIFAGSVKHIMQEIFLSYNNPFFQSASIMHLESIQKDKYTDFACRLFKEFGKDIEYEAVGKLYELFDGVTFYMQKCLNVAFSKCETGKVCRLPDISHTILEILEDNASIYREILANMHERQKDLLYAIAIEGEANALTSAEFIKRYNLLSASSVQAAMKQLIDKEYITRQEESYKIIDRFLSLWIRQIYGTTPFVIWD